MSPSVPAVLRTLARLGLRTRRPPAEVMDLRTAHARAVWLGFDESWSWMASPTMPTTRPLWLPRTRMLDHLAALDGLRKDERLLRIGWGVLRGPARGLDLCTPLASWPIRLEVDGPRRVALTAAGDTEVTALVGDRRRAEWLAEGFPFDGGRLRQLTDGKGMRRPEFVNWLFEVTRAAEVGEPRLLGPATNPIHQAARQCEVVAGFVVYLARRTAAVAGPARPPVHWAEVPGVERTALADLYGVAPPRAPEHHHHAGRELPSPLPLSAAQRAIVAAARRDPITVVSGPPGCGKTHTLVALALDAVTRGDSVLLATRGRHAAEVIGGMLRAAAGPLPVMFGDTEARAEVAAELSALPSTAQVMRDMQAARRELSDAMAAQYRAETAVHDALAAESAAGRAETGATLMHRHLVVAPRLFEEPQVLGSVRQMVDAAGRDRPGPLARCLGWFADRGCSDVLAAWAERAGARARAGPTAAWRAAWWWSRARSLAGSPRGQSGAAVAAALAAAEDMRAALRLREGGGTALDLYRRALYDGDAGVRDTAARWLTAAVTAVQRQREVRADFAELARALQAGRATRRQALAKLLTERTLQALPIWVGTLDDVEDLLPAVPGLFDLVVIDEASHVDQPRAAPALVRGRRGVICGDPRQFRHVRFAGRAQARAAAVAEGAGELADLLDVSRMTLFDLATRTTEVHWLDEHHRCAPHLISFAGERFYPERMALLTTHPAIASAECIDVQLVAGRRGPNRVNEVEVAAVVEHVRRRSAAGATSVGVLSPFRAQADAIERAILAELRVEEIIRMGLRVGTVHSFQGSECDEAVISFTLSDGDPGTVWRFVNDPGLLAVLTTRARRSVHVVTSTANPPGLVGAYLRHAGTPPPEIAGSPPPDEWTAELAAELRRYGHRVRTQYPVGWGRIDLVVGDGAHAVAVETGPHPAGAAAHLDRWRTLRTTGWRLHDAYPTRFDRDPVRAVVEVAARLSVPAGRIGA